MEPAFTLTRGVFGPHVKGKLGKMRKPQEFSVLPRSDGLMMVQSDKSIGTLDAETGKGVLNTKGSYSPYLSPLMGAVPFEFPADFVTLCKEACLEPGGETTVGGITLVNTVKVI